MGLVHFKDAESGRTILVDTSDAGIRRKLQQQIVKYSTGFSMLTRKHGIDTIEVNTQQDYIKEFIKYFKRR